MIKGKFCDDCVHYKETNYFVGRCDITNSVENYDKPSSHCSDFKCKAKDTKHCDEKCINRGNCYV